MKNRLYPRLALALLCVLALGFLLPYPADSLTITGTTPDGFSYKIEPGMTTLTRYTGYAYTLSTPVKVGVRSVTHIGGYAFEDSLYPRELYISDGVTNIGEYAFLNSRIERVDIPSSVTSIGRNAFQNCKYLKSVWLYGKISSIEVNTFLGCTSLMAMSIPSGVTSIGENAFYECSSLFLVTIPSGVTSIGDWAFADCSKLKSLTIPNSVTSIGEYTFLRCPLTISGDTGSYAETYANEHSIPFVSLTEQKVTDITIEPVLINLGVGSTQQLTAAVSPENASDKSLQWSSSNNDFVTVDGNGLVTAVAPGTATITATSQDNSGVSGSAEIAVNKFKYDMASVAWNYTAPFTYDGKVKTVALTGLPAGVIVASYQNNVATDVGSYTASVSFTYDETNYESPIMPDLTWVIEPAIIPALKGDATNDGTIDILDLVSIIDYIVSNTSPASQANADANGDGTVDILDLVWIIDKIVGG